MTKWTLGQVGKTKPIQSQFKANTNPIQSQYKPNTKPIQSQYKPNTNPIQTQTNPNKPNFGAEKMLLYKTINGRRESFGYYADRRLFAGEVQGRRQQFLPANYKLKLDFFFKIRLLCGFYTNNVDWRNFCMVCKETI